MSARRALDISLMRGGTSRGPALSIEAAAQPGPQRDELARSLIGTDPVDGLGGGSPTTSKVVLVGPGHDAEVDLDYTVGNLSTDGSTVDWSGTCGNMTAAVVPFAALTGLLAPEPDRTRFRLRNLSTQGRIDIVVRHPQSLQHAGAEIELTTSYVEPGGAVLGATLPTANPLDVLEVDGEGFDTTIIDVTHPYLFVRYEQTVGDRDLHTPEATERIERIRAAACVKLGVSASADEAHHSSAAVPRIILIHDEPTRGVEMRITAVSMGRPIRSVPVTAAMCLAAARQIAGTLVASEYGAPNDGEVHVVGPATDLRAWAALDESGAVASTSVHRTARCIARGTAWI